MTVAELIALLESHPAGARVTVSVAPGEVADVRATRGTHCAAASVALMLYRKSGLRSRSQLSAFLLEDLLLPRTPCP